MNALYVMCWPALKQMGKAVRCAISLSGLGRALRDTVSFGALISACEKSACWEVALTLLGGFQARRVSTS